MEKTRILITGNWAQGIETIKNVLKGEPYRLESCPFEGVRKSFKDTSFDLLVLSLGGENLPSATAQIGELKKINDALPIVVVTPLTSWEPAVAFMTAGASEYFASPLPKEKFRESLSHYIKLYRLTKKVFFLDKPAVTGSSFEGMRGQSDSLQEIVRVVSAVAKSNATVLIMGESGTGKELVAKAIHRRSDRSNSRFVDLNCGAIPKDLLENELFGHEKGSFTGAHARYQGSFEAAHRGTLFLDEISEMDPLLQVKLLRVLQERNFMRIGGTEKINVDVRIIAATNRNLHEEIKNGRFREDLFYRLNVVNIIVPPLRERREDIPLIAQHFLSYYSAKNNRIFIDFANDTMEALINYDWPGNVRELENTVERLVVLHNASQVKFKFLPKQIQKVNRTITYSREPVGSSTEEMRVVPLDELERRAIEVALLQYRGNISIVARKLKIGQATLYRKVKKYGIQV